eukprot:jgi/Astpho2/6826/Aster-06502
MAQQQAMVPGHQPPAVVDTGCLQPQQQLQQPQQQHPPQLLHRQPPPCSEGPGGGMQRSRSALELSSLGPNGRSEEFLQERAAKVMRYRQKRNARNFSRRISYVCRKDLADKRKRVGGRFARHDDPDAVPPTTAAQTNNSKFLPEDTLIFGYARSKLSDDDLRKKIKPGIGEGKDQDEFLSKIKYIAGQYDGSEGYQKLNEALEEQEKGDKNHRLFYLALPPSVYPQVCKGIHDSCFQRDESKGFFRVVIEKPFGKDLESSEKLAEQINELFPEERLYRIDHYLGKEMMQNMITMRFSNRFLSPMWNAQHISNVQVCFKEPFGTEGRGGYFDEFGIIRDVMQNHLMQDLSLVCMGNVISNCVLSLICMEKPVSNRADDLRDEKVKVLRCIPPVRAEEVVLGQYAAAGGKPGYLEDETVPNDSKTPTFATCVLHIRNERWHGVPFILKAGKALNERKAEIRIQFKPPAADMNTDLDSLRNELVVRLQPDEAVYMKMVVKKPGLEATPVVSEMDLTYKERYGDTHIPEAYERLILDAIRGDQQHFVRRDELRAAWAVFTPLLHAIDKGEVPLLPYKYGTRGPPQSDELVARNGFVKNANYVWSPRSQTSVTSAL